MVQKNIPFLLFALFLICCSPATYAQSGTWVKGGGGLQPDYAEAIAVDSQTGNIYIAGTFKDSMNVEGTPVPHQGETDFFVAAYDSSGSLLWIQPYGWGSSEYVHSIELDGQGHLLVSGEYQDSTIIGSDTLYTWYPGGNFDLFCFQLDLNGNFNWNMSTQGSGSEFLYDVATDNSGNAYGIGKFRSNLELGPDSLVQFTVPGLEDIFLTKISPAGQFIWSIRAGGIKFDAGTDVAVWNDTLIVTAGWYQDTCYFKDSTVYLTSDQLKDVFVAAYDSSGGFRWVLGGTGNGTDLIHSVATDANGDIYVTGTFDTTFTMAGQTFNSQGGFDIFLAKISPSGTPIWIRQIGSPQFETLNELSVAPNGNVIATGYFQGDLTIDGLSISSGNDSNQDLMVVAFDGSGTAQWIRQMGGKSIDEGRAITTDNSGRIYVAGDYADSCFFYQSTLVSSGSDDFFVMRMAPDGSVDRQTEVDFSQISVYPNPSSGLTRLTYQVEGQKEVSLEILSLQGHQILRKRQEGGQGQFQLDLSDLPAGMYLWRLRGDDAHTSGRLLIQH